MIINFSIQNFGSIKDKQTLSFEATKSKALEDFYIIEPIKGLRLLKLGLIYGANASGKTTILKALNFLRKIVTEPLSKKTEGFDFEPFLFDSVTPQQNTIFDLEFVQNKTKYTYQVEFNKYAIVKEKLFFYKSKKAKVFERSTNLKSEYTKIKFGSTIKVDKVSEKTLESNTLWNNTVLAGFLKTNIEQDELKDVCDWFKSKVIPPIIRGLRINVFTIKRIVKSESRKDDIINILKNADLRISDVIIKEQENLSYNEFNEILNKQKGDIPIFSFSNEKESLTIYDIKLEHSIDNKKYLLPFHLESQGTQRYFELAGMLEWVLQNSMIFSIDELEASLHPDLYVHFLLMFLANSKQSQLIATTHNREILNNRDIFRDDAIWFTDKNELSATELYSLADFDSKIIRGTNNVYNAYKTGKLGGIPSLGDYYLDIDYETDRE